MDWYSVQPAGEPPAGGQAGVNLIWSKASSTSERPVCRQSAGSLPEWMPRRALKQPTSGKRRLYLRVNWNVYKVYFNHFLAFLITYRLLFKQPIFYPTFSDRASSLTTCSSILCRYFFAPFGIINRLQKVENLIQERDDFAHCFWFRIENRYSYASSERERGREIALVSQRAPIDCFAIFW